MAARRGIKTVGTEFHRVRSRGHQEAHRVCVPFDGRGDDNLVSQLTEAHGAVDCHLRAGWGHALPFSLLLGEVFTASGVAGHGDVQTVNLGFFVVGISHLHWDVEVVPGHRNGTGTARANG